MRSAAGEPAAAFLPPADWRKGYKLPAGCRSIHPDHVVPPEDNTKYHISNTKINSERPAVMKMQIPLPGRPVPLLPAYAAINACRRFGFRMPVRPAGAIGPSSHSNDDQGGNRESQEAGMK